MLVADDEPSVLHSTQSMLTEFGFTVSCATDGEEAMVVVQDQDTVLSAAILDITMPKLGGLEIYREIRKINPRLPVLFVSGYDNSTVKETVRNDPHVVFVKKPYGMEVLADELHSLLQIPVKGHKK